MRMRLARLALAPTLALASLLVSVVPAAAGVTGGGNGLSCAKADPTTVVTYSSPQQVNISGGGGISCVEPGATNEGFSHGGQPGVSGPPPQPPPKGTACNLQFQEWVEFGLFGGQPEFRIWGPANPASGSTVTVDAMNPNFQPTAWSSAFNDFGVSVDLYNQAGTQNIWIPLSFVGQYDGNGWECKATEGPGTGFVTQCNTNTLCFNGDPGTPPTIGVPIAVGALPIDLNAFVQGRFTGGNVTSLPAQPNPSVVNVPTCVYISNMTVQGGGDPLQPQDWEQIVEGPVAGPDNRHVYFVLLYHVHLVETDVDFGDGTVVPLQPNGSPTQVLPVPAQCGNIPGENFLVAHTYDHYTPAGAPFQVKVTHQFGVDVTELWLDSAGPHTQQFGQVVQVPVLTNPDPFNVTVIQEEGVPVGG